MVLSIRARRLASGEVARRRHHRSLDGAQPAAVFEAVEAPALLGLPVSPFELATWSTPKVGPDCHIRVGRALYSVPWHYIGLTVNVRCGERTVEVFLERHSGLFDRLLMTAGRFLLPHLLGDCSR